MRPTFPLEPRSDRRSLRAGTHASAPIRTVTKLGPAVSTPARTDGRPSLPVTEMDSLFRRVA